jgi:hypothetical protein
MRLKPLEQCNLKDILTLFDIEELTKEEVIKAKKKVILLHPDKNIGKDTRIYYKYFRDAYDKLKEIYTFLNTNTKQSTEYDNDVTTETQKALHLYYKEKDPKDFSKLFNEVFEKINIKSEDGYGEWLKTNEGIYDKDNLETSRKNAINSLIIKEQEIQSINDLENFSDVKEAHINSVITLDVNEVYKKKEKFNSIEEYQRFRVKDTQFLDLSSKKEEHEKVLRDKKKEDKLTSMNMAYEFMKETETNTKKFNNYCSNFLFIKNS